MKVIADTVDNAKGVLTELVDFESRALDIYKNSIPFANDDSGRTYARFLSETSVELRNSIVKDFAKTYPSLNRLAINSTSGSHNSFWRFTDACIVFDEVQRPIYGKKFVLRDDETREKISSRAADVVADLAIYIMIQFGLYSVEESSEVCRSVWELCEEQGITVEVFKGTFLGDLEEVGRTWYSYEVISPYYEALQTFDPVLMGEAEDQNFHLTDDITTKLLNGEIDAVYLRGKMDEANKGSEQVDTGLSYSAIIERMKFS